MRKFLVSASVATLLLCGPAWAQDVSGADGRDGGPGSDGNPGLGGAGSNVNVNITFGNTGGQGQDGGRGDAGTDGEDGIDISQAVTSPATSLIIRSNGGTGGNGGAGGNGGTGGAGSGATSIDGAVSGGRGGDGGDAGVGGDGGDGGNGGAIKLTIDASVAGDVQLTAKGGAGGSGGPGGIGGRGGTGGIGSTVSGVARGGNGGYGGDGRVGGSPGSPGFGTSAGIGIPSDGSLGSPGNSSPELFAGQDGLAGAGGTIVVVVNSAVGGNISADAGDGTVQIALTDSGTVGGVISANAASTSTLKFQMAVKSQSDYRAAVAYLSNVANANGGSITIDGKTYTWSGFDGLQEALALILAAARAEAAAQRQYLICSPRAVTAFYDGDIVRLIARKSSDRPAFRIGHLSGDTFASENSQGWHVAFTGHGSALAFDVLDKAGKKVASCHR